MASSLGLDLSSSSDDDDEKSLRKSTKSPRKVKLSPRKNGDSAASFNVAEVVPAAKVVEPRSETAVAVASVVRKRKKVKLGHSTKENRIDVVFNH